ncbi:MAG: HipA domain-containing protein [Escherichia coli]
MKLGISTSRKFPSVKDEYDVGGWEMVVNALAVGCGLNVAPAQAHKFASNYHCFMVRRFDRTNAGKASAFFASAMTLTRPYIRMVKMPLQV